MLEVFGTIFIIVAGCIFHFLYDWTHQNKIIGFFTAVNESTWEHLKLIIAPDFLWLIVEWHFYHDNPNLYLAKFAGLMTMLLVIPLIFYSYRHFTKKDVLWVDILSFVLAAAAGEFVFYLLINMSFHSAILSHLGMIGLIVILFYYVTHTYVPEKNFLHRDPITNRYGLNGHPRGKKKPKK